MHFWIVNPYADIGDTLALNLAAKAGAADYGDGVMLAFFLPPDALPKIEAQWPKDSSQIPPLEQHVTLAYLGNASSLEESGLQAEHLLVNLRAFAETAKPVEGRINGWGRFNGDDADAVYLNFDAPTLPQWRQDLVDAIDLVAPPASNHGFTPHITLAYVPKGEPVAMVEMPAMVKLAFDTLVLAWGDTRHEIPLSAERDTAQPDTGNRDTVNAAKGGPGSGFHGHAGRPGERGGSAPRGTATGGDDLPVFTLPPDDGKLININKLIAGKVHGQFWEDDPILRDLLAYGPEHKKTGGNLNIINNAFLDKQAPIQKHRVITDLAEKAGLTYDEANDFVRQWADSSNDNDMRSLSIQEVAGETFGIGMGEWQQERMSETVQKSRIDRLYKLMEVMADPAIPMRRQAARVLDEFSKEVRGQFMFERDELEGLAAEVRSGNREIKALSDLPALLIETEAAAKAKIQRAVTAMYENTQQRLAELGITEVRAYRGFLAEGNVYDDLVQATNATFATSPLSSWSLDYAIARDFSDPHGNETGLVIEAVIPAARIFSLPSTGNGCLNEYEVVALGGTDPARVRKVTRS